MREVDVTKKAVLLVAALFGAALTLSPALGNSEGGEPVSLPDGAGSWAVFSDMRVDPIPTRSGSVEVRGVGSFTYDPTTMTTLRPDLFAEGRFSPFDVLVQLAARGEIELEYSYDEGQATFVVRSINGLDGWWYDVRLPGGALERTALRMDSYPIKDGAAIYLYLEDPERLAAIQASFREEAARLATNAGQVVVPVVTVKGPRATATFHDVVVTSHNVRPDVFRPGAITALDVLLSLGDLGSINGLDLTWHATVEDVADVNHYMVDWISLPDAPGEASPTCGYMAEAATEGLRGFLTPHSHATTRIHLSSDLELLVSPTYVEWQWLCATP
jgi:hypothetical protein